MYKIIIKGVPAIDKDQFLKELSQHGEIESLELKGDWAVVIVNDKAIAEGIHADYKDRYLRGKPVTAELE